MNKQVLWDDKQYDNICLSVYTEFFVDKNDNILFYRRDIENKLIIRGVGKIFRNLLTDKLSKPINVYVFINIVQNILGKEAVRIVNILLEQEFLEICR